MIVQTEEFPEFVNVKEAAEILHMSAPTVRRLISGRRIPFYKIRGTILFSKSEIAKFIASSRIADMRNYL